MSEENILNQLKEKCSYKCTTEYNPAEDTKLLLDAEEIDTVNMLKSCGKTVKEILDFLRIIREWHDQQPHLPKGTLDDALVMRYLFMRDFSIERVKESIDNYFSARNNLEFLCNRDPLNPDVEKILREGHWVILPKRTPDNCRISINRLPDKDTITAPLDVLKVMTLICEYRLLNDCATGEHWIIDYKNITLQQVLQWSPMLIVKLMFYTMTCVGAKIKGIHIVNLPSYAETLLSFLIKLMKAKIAGRVHVYSDMSEITQMFPKEIIPEDMGGEGPTTKDITENWRKVLQSPPWRQYFIEQENIKSDESKRLEAKVMDEVFGVEGSFRKLEVD